ncbi:MAG: hypothetical protein BWX89_01019 [candidate division TA06 bacterium ADurb.Bin131]|uniref:Uncharacterized protein n=1 Tax=candidate division TA06 bacterium ADurb.Bin131 TaxID=1852827 RepID=A0A1V6C8Z4_UNCT6|nr:MAG: hypothetical protein BWX89_01019 [candidate division TA06 bacterium ADurb.Bin131]
MAYRPLQKWADEHNKGRGIIWTFLVSVVDDALNFLFSLASTNENKVKKSITTDTDGKAQLVNDLSDTEILSDLVYGTDSNGTRGYKKDTGGMIGTKQVDETGLTNNYILYYDSDAVKWKVKGLTIPSQVGGAYTSSFTIGDWILDRDYYYIVFTHNLNTQPVLVQLWKDKILVFPDSIEIIDNNAIKVKVTADPDNRFYGDILIIKGGDYTGQGPSGGGESLQQLLQPLWYLIY